ncbi:MAG: (2Fe-2S)-binding protein [Thermoanaerobaculia bacterium]|nr:(2Fe-2S)-binding protein [Thermoanaerobaculia bacterium]
MTQPGTCEIQVNGLRLRVAVGSSVAAALLNYPQVQDSILSPSTPVCGMGTCWGCRATIDGIADRRSCLVSVRDGMKVATEALEEEAEEPSRRHQTSEDWR